MVYFDGPGLGIALLMPSLGCAGPEFETCSEVTCTAHVRMGGRKGVTPGQVAAVVAGVHPGTDRLTRIGVALSDLAVLAPATGGFPGATHKSETHPNLPYYVKLEFWIGRNRRVGTILPKSTPWCKGRVV